MGEGVAKDHKTLVLDFSKKGASPIEIKSVRYRRRLNLDASVQVFTIEISTRRFGCG